MLDEHAVGPAIKTGATPRAAALDDYLDRTIIAEMTAQEVMQNWC